MRAVVAVCAAAVLWGRAEGQNCNVPQITGASTANCPESTNLVTNQVANGVGCTWIQETGYFCANCPLPSCQTTCVAATGFATQPGCVPITCAAAAPVLAGSSTVCAQNAHNSQCPIVADIGFDCSAITVTCTGNAAAAGTWTPSPTAACAACCGFTFDKNVVATTEAGTSDTFTLRLTTAPKAPVTIQLASTDTTEATVTPSSVTFGIADFATPRIFTVTGQGDNEVDGNKPFTITVGGVTSADPGYNGADPLDVTGTNTDVTTAGVSVFPTVLTTTEAGSTATFTVILQSMPSAGVSIPIVVGNTAEGTASRTTVDFTPANWNIGQVVTITGVNDFVDDGDVVYTVDVGSPATSGDANYRVFDPDNVQVTNTDDDTRGVSVTPTAGLTTTEAGGTATFTVVLTAQPLGQVSIGVSSTLPTEGTANTAALVFTTANWNIPQVVTVTGQPDAVVDGTQAYTIVLAQCVSPLDAQYATEDPPDVALTNSDANTAGITVTPKVLTTTEAGGTAQFTVVLNTKPTQQVTIAVTSGDLTEATVTGGAALTFTDADWNIPKPVTLQGVQDQLDDGDITFFVNTGLAGGTDPVYQGMLVDNVQVTNTDDDVANVIITPTAGMVVAEPNGATQYTVALASIPSAQVSINFLLNDGTEATLAPTGLTFNADATALNPQTITVTAVDDSIDDGTRAWTITPTITGADAKYTGLVVPALTGSTTDDDTFGILVTQAAGLITSEAGTSVQYTIQLQSQPTHPVTIPISSSLVSEGTVSTAAVTFTTANWNQAQTVIVTGANDDIDDGDQAYQVTNGPATSQDANYGGLSGAVVPITNTDDDTVDILVSKTTVATSEDLTTDTFTVVLQTKPVANVLISVSSSLTTEATVNTAQLTFTTTDWNNAQTVVVTGVDESIEDGPQAYQIILGAARSGDPLYNNFDPTDLTGTNADNDAVGIIVTPSAGLQTSEAGATATFTVALRTQPTANVRIPIASLTTAEGTVDKASLTFTTTDWMTPQVVTITGQQDAVQDGPVAYTIAVQAAVSVDARYNLRDAGDVSVINNDDDAVGVTVSPTTALVTTEAGGTATFTVVLNSMPTQNVVITLTSSLPTEGTVPASITFTAADWNQAQTVVVTGVNDDVDDGDQAYTITTSVAAGGDPNYNGVPVSDVSVTNTDDDTASVIVVPNAGLVTTEAGGTATFRVRLASRPTLPVTIALTSSDTTEGTITSVVPLVFTTADWMTDKVVTVTGQNDDLMDGTIDYTITGTLATGDTVYRVVTMNSVAVQNTDDDVAAITVTAAAKLTVSELGTKQTYTVVLASKPTSDVSVPIQSLDPSEGTVLPTSITFTTLNWNLAQTVELTGADDAITDGTQQYVIRTGAATSADGNYQGMQGADVAAETTDNDAAGITITPTIGLVTTEAGGTATFTVVLNSQPTSDLVFPLSSDNVAEGTINPTSLTFQPANWNVAQTVTVTGVDEKVSDGNIAYNIVTGIVQGGDPAYTVDPRDVSVTNTDDDFVDVTVTPTTGLSTTEAGGTATFTVVLNSKPTTTVQVPFTSSLVTEGTVSPAMITFNPANWNVAQTVTVTGVADAVDDGNTAYTIVVGDTMSGDPKYNGYNPTDVSVTNNDLNTAGITVSPTNGLITTEAGGQARFTVVLNTQPTDTVTIGLTTDNGNECTLAPSTLSFTAADWNQNKEVVVTGRDDSIDDGDVVYNVLTGLASSPTDTTYNGMVSDDVQLTNTDDDTVGVTVTPRVGLTTAENGGNAQFTVQLDTQPTATVTITLASSDTAEATVGAASIEFTTLNWMTAQTVVVTGVDETVADGNKPYTIVTGLTTTDVKYNTIDPADVTLTSIDDDTANIIVAGGAALSSTEGGATSEYTVVLGSQPMQDVTIPITPQSGEVSTSPVTLTFNAANWNTVQTVTVTAVNDIIDDGDKAFTIANGPAASTDVNYQGISGTAATGTAVDDDTVGIRVLPATPLTTTEAGGTDTFTIVLLTQPTAPVTIDLVSGNTAEVSLSAAFVTFDVLNWNVAQTVVVTGVDEKINDGDQAVVITTVPARSGDPKYATVNAEDVTVNNIDDDVVGLTVTTTNTVTSEDGTTISIGITLKTRPTNPVTVPFASSVVGEGVPIPAAVVFAPEEWDQVKTVIIRGVDDDVVDGTQAYSITIGPSGSADLNYVGLSATAVALTNTDNDAVGFTIAPTAVTTSEDLATGTFTVMLNSRPTQDVTLPLSSSDPTEGTVAPASLLFTTTNWNVPQPVTVTGVNDDLADGTQTFLVVTDTAQSADPLYVIDPIDVTVQNTDNDVFGVTVGVPTVQPGEDGTVGRFTVVLTSMPTSSVVIPVVSADATEGVVQSATLTFTAADWNVPQEVLVTGVDDQIVDGPVQFTVSLGNIVSSDANYKDFDPQDVLMVNADNDAASINVAPTNLLVTTEAGGTAEFVITMNAKPTTNVDIAVASNNLNEGTVSTPTVTFTSANWNTPQTVTVTGVDDPVADGNVAYTITTADSVSADAAFNGLTLPDVSVTNNDNDSPGYTVTPLIGTTTEAGGTAQFSVVLNTKPTQTVNVGVTSSDVTEGRVDLASLAFTDTTWNVPQMVTVTGQDDAEDDGDIAFNIVTTVTTTDADYTALNPRDVAMTNTDDDTAGVSLSATTGLITREEGTTTDTFTVVLNSMPTQPVDITLTTSDPAEGSVLPAALRFEAATWNIPQVVTVTGVDERIDDGDKVYSIITSATASTDAKYLALVVADVTVTNIDNDVLGIVVSKTVVATSEPNVADTFTVVLSSMPTSQVVIPLSVTDATEALLSTVSLTFLPAAWNVPQQVTVTGVDDSIDDGPIAYLIKFAATQSTDANYNNVILTDITGSNDDDETARVVLTALPPLITTEAGGTTGNSIRIALGSQPTADVVVAVDLANADTTEGLFAPNPMTFTAANWNVEQTLTVTGVDDLIDDGDVRYTLKFLPVVSTDVTYNGMVMNDIEITNTDDDTAGVILTPAVGPLTTTEAGGTATFTMRLSAQPTSDVTIPLVSSILSEGTISPNTIKFTTLTWNVDQTVTVTGVNDQIQDGDIMYTIHTDPAISNDPAYKLLDAADITAVNTDDDTAGITVAPTTQLDTDEGGKTATFTVVLTSEPTGEVQVPLTSDKTDEATLDQAALTFNAINWNIPQNVVVTGVNDAEDDGDQPFVITFGPVRSNDARYSVIVPAPLNGVNRDDDTGTVIIDSGPGTLTTKEDGTAAQFTLSLSTRPTSEVAFVIASTDDTEGLVSPKVFTLNSMTWQAGQVITMTGVDDFEIDGDINYQVQFTSVTSTDPIYSNLNVGAVVVVNEDDDVAGVTITPETGLETSEDGATATFTVQLIARPTSTVTIGITSSMLTEGTVSPATLQFSTAATEWNRAQTVTITGVDDAIADGPIAYQIVTGIVASADRAYAGINPADVTVTNIDNEIATVIVNPTRVFVNEEGATTATFTLVLSAQPQQDVTVPVASSDINQVTLSPASVAFTTMDWNVEQTITVRAVDDLIAEGVHIVPVNVQQVVTLDNAYSMVDPTDVEVSITDNDTPALIVDPTVGLVTTEKGGTATFTVQLATKPSGTTTVTIASLLPTEGIANAASLSFNSISWDTPQVVTVTGVQDQIPDGNVLYQVKVGPVASTDAIYNGLAGTFVSLENTDDDTPGVTVNPSGGLVTTEAGGTATFTIRLNTAPSADVAVTLASSDLTEGKTDLTNLIFTPANWNLIQTVIVKGVDDIEFDGDVAYELTVRPAGSTDTTYSNFAEIRVSATNTNDEFAEYKIDMLPPLVTSEWGLTATFAVSLLSPCSDRLVTGVASSNIAEGTASPATLTFLPTSWNIAQTVTVTGVDDAVDDGDVTFIIDISVPTTTDPNYATAKAVAVAVLNLNDDPVRPLLCSDNFAGGCLLRQDANAVRCVASGCTATLCCEVCDSMSTAACASGQLIATAATTQCAATGCSTDLCCYFPPPPPGSILCSSYTSSCQIRANPDRIICDPNGCTDNVCCEDCSSWDPQLCVSGLIRTDASTTPCSARGCDATTCCRPDKCFGVFCPPITQCHSSGTCDLRTGTCSAPLLTTGTTCDDNDDLTIGDACTLQGTCVGAGKCVGVVCTQKSQCHSVGLCNPDTGFCSEPIVANGVTCNDGSAVTTRDVCESGICVGAVTCNNQECKPAEPQCNTAGCENGMANNINHVCVELPMLDGTLCDDGLSVTYNDKCIAGKCIGERRCKNQFCTPKSQCHGIGECDESSGVCTTPLIPDGTKCDDNDKLTTDDVCYKGQCLGQDKCLSTICRASTQCHQAGTCDPDTGFCSDPFEPAGITCDDNDPATTDDRCDGAGNCIGSLPCRNSNGVGNNGNCVASDPQCSIARCAQNGECTQISMNDGTPCNDANIVTVNDMCTLGICAGTFLCKDVECQGDQCHTQGVCDPATGRCTTPIKPDQSPCNDGKTETVKDVCVSGICTGQPACANVVCKASAPCRAIGVCDPTNGRCTDPVLADNTLCDDDDTGTDGDRCLSGICVGTTPCGAVQCVSTEPQCRRAYCSGDRCAEISREDGTVCNDDNPITTDDQCKAGTCVGEIKCKNVICPATDACREPSLCDPLTGICEERGIMKPDMSPCDDGNLATTEDRCQGGTCVGKPVCVLADCVKRDQCHQDGVCEAVTGLCTTPQVADGTVCNDGDSTTLNDRCQSGICIGTVDCGGRDCVSNDPQCKRAVCNGNSCSELPRADGTYCTDNNSSTRNDQCLSGVCVGTDPCTNVICKPSAPCHSAGVCHAVSGVCSTPVMLDGTSCDDQQLHTVNDKCMNGICIGTDLCIGKTCPATECRSQGTCDHTTGECISQALPDGTECDDGDGATVEDRCLNEACVGRLQCGQSLCTVTDPHCFTAVCENDACLERVKPDQTPCSDGLDQTTGDQCVSGQCIGVDLCASVTCTAKGQCFGSGTCDPLSGKCTSPVLPDGTLCNDGISSTRDDQCATGRCVGVERCKDIRCTASDNCHDVGVCNPATGLCSDPERPSGMACNDNDPLTTDDKCISGVCTGSVPCGTATCRASSPECNVASCVNGKCQDRPKLDGALCNDGDVTTMNDKCAVGICSGVNPCDSVICTGQASNACMLPGECEPATGVCSHTPEVDGVPCNDLDSTTSDDKCQTGTCRGYNKCEGVVCAATDACHVPGQCQFATGTCTDPISLDGTICDDSNIFSINDQCVAGVCIGTTQCTPGGPTCRVSDPQCQYSACSQGLCVEISKADGTVCNDGRTSTLGDVCTAGACAGADICDNIQCNAGMCNEAGVCDPTTGQCASSSKPDKTACDDLNPLTIDDQCFQGICRGRERCEGVVCDRKGPCIGVGVCDMGVCSYSKVADGTLCNDGNPQSATDKCLDGVCVGAVSCVGQDCTADDAQCGVPACNANTCVSLSKADGLICDDGDSATTGDMCANGLCKGVRKCDSMVCAPISMCHYEGTCEPSTGKCSTPVKPNGTKCDDGNPLSMTSECFDGVCVSTDKCLGQGECKPLTQCHAVGICDPANGKCTTSLKIDGDPCDDGDSATELDICSAGVCKGTPRCTQPCVASDQCHLAGQCDPLNGICSDPASGNGVSCNDNDPATTMDRCLAGACIGQTTCGNTVCSSDRCKKVICVNDRCEQTPMPDGTTCNDENPTTRDDMCRIGECVGISLCTDVGCDAGQCTNLGTCNPLTGKCEYSAKPDGTDCDDGNTNTYNDVCTSRVCRGTQKCQNVVCGARSQCHNQGVCDVVTGMCTSPLKPGFAPCDDMRADTQGDQCQAGSCIGEVTCGTTICTNNNPQCATMACVMNQCVEVLNADGTMCDDMNDKTLNDKCQAGICSGDDKCFGVVCTATSQCHLDGECEPLTGKCTRPLKKVGSTCNDNNPTTLGDTCKGDGACSGVDKCANVVCSPSDQCHSVGTCNSLTGQCTDPVLDADTPCDDGDPTTTDDRCGAGACSGSRICGGNLCRSSNPGCSIPVCTSDNRCSEQPKSDGLACNDNDLSTTTDSCRTGVCVGTNPCNSIVCQALTQCHGVGVCNPLTAQCSNPILPDQTTCDDGEDFTGNDVCSAGVCTGVYKCQDVVCRASDVCHGVGVCNERTGLCTDPPVQTSQVCNDNNLATFNDKCVNGVCTGVITCGTDTCVSSDPACMIVKCLNGQCAEVAQSDGVACNDNDPTTFSDRCLAGKCQGTSLCKNVVCPSPTTCHQAGVCDPQTGRCLHQLKLKDTSCDDNNAATVDDSCTALGLCAGVQKCKDVICTATDTCHVVGTCNPSTGVCSDPVKASGTACDDGNPDTTADTCQDGVCGGSLSCAGKTCTAPFPSCQLPSCQAGKCTITNKPDGLNCNDGSLGTRDDVCTAGMCIGTENCASVTCTPTDSCHAEGVCEPTTGICSNPLQADGFACDDANTRTTTDQCLSGVCVGREKCAGVVCSASDSCHAKGQCEPATGLCTDPVISDTTICNDQDISTQDDRCAAGVCIGFVRCGANECTSPNPCMRATCVNDQCSEVTRPDGTVCNDGNVKSSGDKCLAGKCVGVDKCASQTCPAPDQCHFLGECDVLTGGCSSPTKPDRTRCDDLDDTTKDDICMYAILF